MNEFNHAMMVHSRQSFVLGMELAMRIARNLSTGKELTDPVEQKLQTAIGTIRIVQVEIGSGRMPLPEPHEWTPDEIDEVERIS
jgi:hypothetical protein